MVTTLQQVEIREGMDGLTPSRIATLYRRAPLLRPTGDREAIRRMFEASQLVLSAWDGDHLLGVARVLTDGELYALLADLAVEPDVQGFGMGERIVFEPYTREIYESTRRWMQANELFEDRVPEGQYEDAVLV
jgi:hypothetical protein